MNRKLYKFLLQARVDSRQYGESLSLLESDCPHA